MVSTTFIDGRHRDTGHVPAELRSLTVHVDTGRWSDTVLTDVDLAVPAGRITALLGGPGAGKTMIARALTGRLPATASATGEIMVEGTVGYVPQDGGDAFAPDRPVGDQLRELEHRHRACSVDDALAAAQYPSDAADLLPHHHSAGQIQRAALAAVLLAAPDLLVADGPTASLDWSTTDRVWAALRAYADGGAAVLAVTHDAPVLTPPGIAEHIAVLHRGRILASGALSELAASAEPAVRMYFQPYL